MVSLLQCMLDEAKDSLLTCAPTDMVATQGYAKAIYDIHRMLTRPDHQKETTSV